LLFINIINISNYVLNLNIYAGLGLLVLSFTICMFNIFNIFKSIVLPLIIDTDYNNWVFIVNGIIILK